MIELNVHRSHYAPLEDGADERERLSTYSDTLTFDNARECADWLEREGLQAPSQSHGSDGRTWLSDVDAYEDPYTGILTEQSAHPRNVHPRVWIAIVESVRFPGH